MIEQLLLCSSSSSVFPTQPWGLPAAPQHLLFTVLREQKGGTAWWSLSINRDTWLTGAIRRCHQGHVVEPARGSEGEAGGTHHEAQLAEFLGTQGSPALRAEGASRHLALRLKSSLAQGLEEIPLFLRDSREEGMPVNHTESGSPWANPNVFGSSKRELPQVEETKSRLGRRVLPDL